MYDLGEDYCRGCNYREECRGGTYCIRAEREPGEY